MSDEMPLGPVHVFDGERCIHCGVNVYDSYIYGPDDCIDYPERKRVWTFEEGRNDMEVAALEREAEFRRKLAEDGAVWNRLLSEVGSDDR